MKKKLILLVGLLSILIIPSNVFALSASVKCSAPSSVTVGQTFNVTISGSADISTYWNGSAINSSSNLRSNSGTGVFVEQNSTSSVSKTYSFTALSEGTATVSQTFNISDENYNDKAYTSNTCTINITKPATSSSAASSSNSSKSNSNSSTTSTQVNKSSDSSLKSLSIEGIELKPKFDKNVLEYNVELSSNTTSIKVITEKNDDTATVSGDGEIEVKEGNNVIQILVTAENGESRSYVINAYVQEKEAITVKINNDKYTVIKKLTGIDIPDGFEEKTIVIKDTEIEAFYNKKLDYTLVALKDPIGNILLYIYDENTQEYTKYLPIVSNGIKLIVLDADYKKIPHRYNKSIFNYNGEEVIGYALDETSDFRLIYAQDVATGEKNFYLYDLKYHTLQRFYNDQVNIYIDLLKKVKLAFMILGGFILFLTIIIIVLLSKNVKFKKKYLKSRLSPIDNTINNVKYQDLEGSTILKKEELVK